MIWTSSVNTFTKTNQLAIETILKQSPCANISVFSDSLPVTFFKSFADVGFNIHVESIQNFLQSHCEQYQSVGCKFHALHNQNRNGPHWPVHRADHFRILALHALGGNYVDFDHVPNTDIFSGRLGSNVLGTEKCSADNPDCLDADSILRIGLTSKEFSVKYRECRRQNFNECTVENEYVQSYSPCNGVMLNWQRNHWFLRSALADMDENYDPTCWGCLGPRLFGRLLKQLDASTQPNILLLPPGIIYAYDFRLASEAISLAKLPAHKFYENSTGYHLYGKITASMRIERKSVVGKALNEYSLFGLDSKWHVQKPGVSMCMLCMGAQSNTIVLRKHKKFHSLPETSTEFERKAQHFSAVMLCNPKFEGIRLAAERVTQKIGLPIIYTERLTNRRIYSVVKQLRRLGIKQLFIHGLIDGILDFVDYASKQFSSLSITVVYHSGVGVFNAQPNEAIILGRLLDMRDKLTFGFVEADHVKLFRSLGINAIPLRHAFTNNAIPDTVVKNPHGTLKLGLFVDSTRAVVKNFWTQLTALCLFEGAQIHLIETGKQLSTLIRHSHLRYCKSTLVFHPHMPHHELVHLTRTLDLLTHVTWTDALPGMVLDALSNAVPVLVSDNTEIFSSSVVLTRTLVVPRVDDPIFVFNMAKKAIKFTSSSPTTLLQEISALLDTLSSCSYLDWICALSWKDTKCKEHLEHPSCVKHK
tara:strand:- start:85 stop:2187 length:2103 start_codon:yes stop_codon:yes gene_type:complete